MDKSEIYERMKGRTPEQKKVIKYFNGLGGCLSAGLKDEDYEAIVMAIAKSTDFKQKALNKMGLDESQVNEIEPVHFEGYLFEAEAGCDMICGKDKVWRSSKYQITWLFFSSSQIYLYQYTFNLNEDGKKESTQEYFYEDITNFTTSSETVERMVLDKVSCSGNRTSVRKNIDYNIFTIVVPGVQLNCSMVQNDLSEKSIQGMKAKLREKKG
jgi:hypothetical protein